MEFKLTDEDEKKYIKWHKKHQETCPIPDSGAIGGKETFLFTPTGVGLVIRIECGCGEELDLETWRDW